MQPGTTSDSVPRRKLIEVSLPLEDINSASERENYIYRGNPSSVHKWWAQRPLATARAVLFAQLVDDPSSDPSLSADEQKEERERLHNLIRQLVVWENATNERLLREAHDEILRSTGGNPPKVLDPFAGGGTIPLEAQRLGLSAQSSDLNPVAVLINKSLLETPIKFADRPPVSPEGRANSLDTWKYARGISEDIRHYGKLMIDRAWEELKDTYPNVSSPEQNEARTLAWLWARTVTCPNPSCGILMPLIGTWWLSKKKGKEAFLVPSVTSDKSAQGGRRVVYEVSYDKGKATPGTNAGTASRTGAKCVACLSPVDLKYIRHEASSGRMSAEMVAVVAEGTRRRHYLTPRKLDISAANVEYPDGAPVGELPEAALSFRIQGYGMKEWADLFTNRQLLALTTFSNLIPQIRQNVLEDALNSGMPLGEPLHQGGSGAQAYADAIATYLAFAVDKHADYGCSLAVWFPKEDRPKNLFARQAIPMVWDYPEVSPFTSAGGGLEACVRLVSTSLDTIGRGKAVETFQASASSRDYDGVLVSTDPPYYDNIGYANLSDFFYVWLRKSLSGIYPDLFSTMLVPKSEELISEPHRHGGKAKAEKHFESGFRSVFSLARQNASDDYPITVYYAFKQKELEKEGLASTGWSTFLEGMINEGWMITATWPVRSERGSRMISMGTNALASSIVLALRPRKTTAPVTDRTGFLAALHTELEEALPRIREGAIAPADLRQTILGPGMAVFSRYSRVLEDDGSTMSVKTALALINQTFDALQNEHDAELDAETRFCLDWFRSYGWSTYPYGDAESLAVPLGLSVDGIARGGILTSGGGKVALIKPLDLDSKWDPAGSDRLSLWEVTCHLARAYATEGREAAAKLMVGVKGKVDLDEVNRLATRLYELMESQDASTAGLFNGLGGAWADVSATSTTIRPAAVAETLFEGDY